MNIELSAVKAWKDANKDAAEKRVLQRDAMARVVLPLAERMLGGEKPNYLYEIGKIIEATQGDAAKRDAQLHQIMGIAEQQGILVYEEVEAQIERLTNPDALRNFGDINSKPNEPKL